MLKYGAVIPVSRTTSKNNAVRNISYRNPSNNETIIISTDTSSSDPIFNSITTNKLKTTNLLISTTNSFQPIINYNNYEKKYIVQTSINGDQQISLNNIINIVGEQITFIGKVISKDLNNNISTFTFSGYTKSNNLNFTLNMIYSDDPTNWKIKSMNINNLNLVFVIGSNQPTTTNWTISLDSISI